MLVKKYFLIGIGGALGSILRYSAPEFKTFAFFPLRILLVNLIGCFLIGVILTFVTEIKFFDKNLRIGVTSGFLGGLTTFSTVCGDVFRLLSKGEFLSAFLNFSISIVLGFLAVALGFFAIREIERFFKKRESHLMEDEVE